MYDEAKAAAYLDDTAHAEEVGYYYWLQFVLDRQLQAVRSYAEERGVFLKGDLPIGVAPHSVDVWMAPPLFHTEQSAGAPPDDFAADGQNWGFPTYNWERMQEEGDFRWWRQRFERQARYFHAISSASSASGRYHARSALGSWGTSTPHSPTVSRSGRRSSRPPSPLSYSSRHSSTKTS